MQKRRINKIRKTEERERKKMNSSEGNRQNENREVHAA